MIFALETLDLACALASFIRFGLWQLYKRIQHLLWSHNPNARS